MELKAGTISHLQEYVAAKVKERGFEDETLQERLLLLAEELGELINACRKISGMNVDKAREIKNETGEEITDVINLVFCVGIQLGLNLEEEFLKKEKIIDARNYERTLNKVN
jgi:NTP pyrophosphatase (non-canonical NTP hydrolase)